MEPITCPILKPILWISRVFNSNYFHKGKMYIVGQSNRLGRCLTTLEALIILKELHEGVARGHFATNITTKKILDASYRWPTLLENTHEFYKSCDNY
jgi:hypothetical protein